MQSASSANQCPRSLSRSSMMLSGSGLDNNMSCLRYPATICLFICLLHIAHTATSITSGLGNNYFVSNNNNSSEHFLYFAYGSNLLKERLHVRNPSAAFVTTGRLKDHSLRLGHWTPDFDGNCWHGGVATIERSEGEDVWGVVWRLNMRNLITLDSQEGVKAGRYRPLEVRVLTDDGEMLCRTYKMNDYKPYLTSPPYKKVVCLGAIQNGLPQDYIDKLQALETNGYSGPSIVDTIPGLSPGNKNWAGDNNLATAMPWCDVQCWSEVVSAITFSMIVLIFFGFGFSVCMFIVKLNILPDG